MRNFEGYIYQSFWFIVCVGGGGGGEQVQVVNVTSKCFYDVHICVQFYGLLCLLQCF